MSPFFLDNRKRQTLKTFCSTLILVGCVARQPDVSKPYLSPAADPYVSSARPPLPVRRALEPLIESFEHKPTGRYENMVRLLHGQDSDNLYKALGRGMGRATHKDNPNEKLNDEDYKKASTAKRAVVSFFTAAPLFDLVDLMKEKSNAEILDLVTEFGTATTKEGPFPSARFTSDSLPGETKIDSAENHIRSGEFDDAVYKSLVDTNRAVFAIVERSFVEDLGLVKEPGSPETEETSFLKALKSDLTFQNHLKASLMEGALSVSQSLSILFRFTGETQSKKSFRELLDQVVSSRVVLSMAHTPFGVLAPTANEQHVKSPQKSRAQFKDNGRVIPPLVFQENVKIELDRRKGRGRAWFHTLMGCPVSVRSPMLTPKGLFLSKEPPLHEFIVQYMRFYTVILERSGFDLDQIHT